MTMTTKDFRRLFEHQRGKQLQIEKEIASSRLQIKALAKDRKDHEQALWIIKEAGLKTQEKLAFHISDISTMAMDAVFNEGDTLILDFIERRDKIECDIWFEDPKGNRIKPIDSDGGGAVDVASFSLRIASWSMQQPRTRPVIFLDEPMKNISPEYKELASEMIKQVSKKLGIQFIIINHEPALTSHADRVFSTTKKNRISKITKL